MRVSRVDFGLVPDSPRPAWQVLPEPEPEAGAVIFHGYGGCKEAMLGLALPLAEVGFACIVPDLPGHGEHPKPFGPTLLEDVRAAGAYARRYGPLLSAGHSLGGRLALLAEADAVVSFSPALPLKPSPEGTYALRTFATPKVRQDYPGQVVDVLRGLPQHSVSGVPVLLVIGEEDIPGIVAAVEDLASSLDRAELVRVSEGMLLEAEEPPPGFLAYLRHWVNHSGMPTNLGATAGAAEWAENTVQTLAAGSIGSRD